MTRRDVWIAGLSAFALMYASIWLFVPLDVALMRHLWFLPGIGVLGATVANTSGTGGGVVFVPVFNALRIHGILALTPVQIVAASFCIQCFGMSMGSLRWGARIHDQAGRPLARGGAPVRISDFWKVVSGVLLVSLPIMLATQRLWTFNADHVLIGFKIFSILLGITLIATAWTVNRSLPERAELARIDLIVVMLLAIAGGFVTALFSVGVGEVVALYLFIRHYPILMSTGAATVISSISVLSGSIWHIEAGTVPWEVVALAGPGALVGGFIARPLALWLGALRLKTLDGLWIILSSLYLIYLRL